MAQLFDLVIIGAGAAGMSAALYAGRAKLKTIVLEREREGGQIKITNDVENYPGIINISGEALSTTMRRQAENFGVLFANQTVERVDFEQDLKQVFTADQQYTAPAVIIATGAVPRLLGFVGEDEYQGRGVSYCATCDGQFFNGKEVLVVGGGLAAAEETLFLTRYVSKATILVRKDKLSVPKSIADRVESNPKIELRFNTELKQIGGDHALRYAELLDNKTGKTQRFEVANPNDNFGVFVFAGYIPQTAEFADVLELDQQGYIITNDGMLTCIDGVYAAGDVRPKELRQLVTAVADGAIAATNAEKYIDVMRDKLGLPVFEVGEPDRKADASLEDRAGELQGADPTADQAQSDPADFADSRFFTAEIVQQLKPLLERFEKQVSIVAIRDSSTSLGVEIRQFLSEFAALTDKVAIQHLEPSQDPELEHSLHADILPSIILTDAGGRPLGVQFHGVPSGHELNSFVLALYNASGPGQEISDTQARRITAVDKGVSIKIGATLYCTMCPEVVASSQLIALRNPNITAEMLDVEHFPDFQNQWNIMSVPAIIINDQSIVFGKRSLDEMLDLISA
jgi:thioredoxin reductase (NADPH)